MIVCIGDSITAGQLVEPERAWPRLLKGEIVARGVPGDTTRHGLLRFPADVQESGAEIAIIQFGHNDCNRWQTDRGLPRVSEDAFAANLEEMVDRCVRFGIRPMLCTLTPSFRSQKHGIDTMRYSEAIEEVARFKDAYLIDVRAGINRTHLLDGLHLNEEGHRRYAEIVQANL